LSLLLLLVAAVSLAFIVSNGVGPPNSNIRWKIFHLLRYYDRKVKAADFKKLNLVLFPAGAILPLS
jgi:hypothetical protein